MGVTRRFKKAGFAILIIAVIGLSCWRPVAILKYGKDMVEK